MIRAPARGVAASNLCCVLLKVGKINPAPSQASKATHRCSLAARSQFPKDQEFALSQPAKAKLDPGKDAKEPEKLGKNSCPELILWLHFQPDWFSCVLVTFVSKR